MPWHQAVPMWGAVRMSSQLAALLAEFLDSGLGAQGWC